MTETHLSQETFVLLAAGTIVEQQQPHLSWCTQCQAELASWQRLAMGARDALSVIEVPAFDKLVIPALPATTVEVARPRTRIRPRWTFGHAVQISLLLFATHLRLLLRLAVPIAGAGMAVATVAALQVPTPYAAAVFASIVCLVALASALCVCVPALESRTELFVTTPVSPSAVVLTRTVLVFGLSLGAAAVGSFIVAARLDISAGALILAWLGPSTLAGAVALLVSVWRSAAAAAVIGGMLWLLGTLSVTMRVSPTSPHLLNPTVFAAFAKATASVWSTTPFTLALSALLLVAACLLAGQASRNKVQTGWRLAGS